MAKKAQKLASEYLKDRISKFKQDLNYILMIINQIIVVTFLNLQKKIMKNCTSSKLPFLNFWISELISKNPSIRKISNKHFHLC